MNYSVAENIFNFVGIILVGESYGNKDQVKTKSPVRKKKLKSTIISFQNGFATLWIGLVSVFKKTFIKIS